jgi:hypothetical protein
LSLASTSISPSNAQIGANERIHYLKRGEAIAIPLPDSLCLLYPYYENANQLKEVLPVRYTPSAPFPASSLADSLALGSYWVSPAGLFPPDSLLASYAILEEYADVVQFVITQSSGYTGYLEELLNVPFVLPPRRLRNGKHQTDLLLAVDCAELAIYGRRRQGYNIPYCGPKRIARYMSPTLLLRQGTVIHFGHQVSVLYEDRGEAGVLDGDDLLIHAYTGKAEIIRLRDTDLLHRRYTLYEWE